MVRELFHGNISNSATLFVQCEMDDYAPLVQEMQKAGLIKAHRRGCGGRVGPIGSKVKVS